MYLAADGRGNRCEPGIADRPPNGEPSHPCVLSRQYCLFHFLLSQGPTENKCPPIFVPPPLWGRVGSPMWSKKMDSHDGFPVLADFAVKPEPFLGCLGEEVQVPDGVTVQIEKLRHLILYKTQ